MNYVHYLIILLLFQISCISSAQQKTYEQIKVERKPFRRSSYVIKQPKKPREEDLKSEGISDPKSKVVIVDEKAGKYEFRWTGYDGKEKIVEYQRHDAIDGHILSTTEKNENGVFLYKYQIMISASSPSSLVNFIVYTLSTDTKAIKQEQIQSGTRHPLLSVNDNYLWLIPFPDRKYAIIE